MIINDLRCVSCGRCESHCKSSAIKLVIDSKKRILPSFNNNCIKCGECIDICPAKAIYEVSKTIN